MKTKYIIIISVFLFILLGIFTENNSYDPIFSFAIYIGFFVFEVYLIKKRTNYFLPLFLILSLLLVILLLKVAISGFNSLHKEYLFIFIVFAFLFALAKLYTSTSKLFKSFIVFEVLIFSFFVSFILFNIVDNKAVFGTYDGSYNTPLNNIAFIDKNLKSFTFEKNKAYVIDVWNNGCGVCIMKFPLFEKLKNNYKNNDNVEFIGLNVYQDKSEIKDAQTILKDYNFTGRNYFLNYNQLPKIPVSFYPTVLVVKNNKIVFRGSIETLNIFSYKYL